MTQGLTPQQRAWIALIEACEADGYSPSFDELREGLGLASKSGVHRIVQGLKARGCIDYHPGSRRSLRILHQDWSPGALDMAPTEELHRLVATAAGLLARREGGEATFQLLDRIGRRLSGRPLGGN